MSTTIAIWAPKGGVGRSTIALHIAGRLAAQGRRVLLHDADPQGSSSVWAALAEQVRDEDQAGPLPFVVGRGGSGYDMTVIDCGPTDGPLPRADLYVVPVSLDGVALAVGLNALARLRDEGHAPLVVANKYRADRAEHRAALVSPALAHAVVIRDRAAWAGFFATGRLVDDPAHGRALGIRLARGDMDALMGAIDTRLAVAAFDPFADIFPPRAAAAGRA